MTAPKTTSKRIDQVDAKDTFAGEVVAGRAVAYKVSPYSYYYRSSRDYRTIHLGEGNKTIKGTLYATLNMDELKEFLAWVKANTAWHKTTVRYEKPKQSILTGSFDLPVPEVTKAVVDSTFHRIMTDQFTADLAKVTERKAARAAKQRAETAERAKKQRAEDAARKKKLKQQEERDALLVESAKANREFGDLAQALKVLKKHGLKIVTVDEDKQ